MKKHLLRFEFGKPDGTVVTYCGDSHNFPADATTAVDEATCQLCLSAWYQRLDPDVPILREHLATLQAAVAAGGITQESASEFLGKLADNLAASREER